MECWRTRPQAPLLALHSLATYNLCLDSIICKMGLTAPTNTDALNFSWFFYIWSKACPRATASQEFCFCCSTGTALWRGPRPCTRGVGGGRQGHPHAGQAPRWGMERSREGWATAPGITQPEPSCPTPTCSHTAVLFCSFSKPKDFCTFSDSTDDFSLPKTNYPWLV